MKLKLALWLASIALLGSPVSAAAFQLKGQVLGTSSGVACGHSPVLDRFGDLMRELGAEAKDLVAMGTTECEVQYASFGGSEMTIPAKLLFLDDALIVVKLELNQLSLANSVDIYRALVGEFGKPKRTIKRPFVTDTWRREGQTLVFERLGREWDDNDITVILRQDAGYLAYQRRVELNRIQIEKVERQKKRMDIR